MVRHSLLQILGENILFSVNDCQHNYTLSENFNWFDPSTVQYLHLGSLPDHLPISSFNQTSIVTSGFRGCIRNVLSNGYYLNMSNYLDSNYSYAGECQEPRIADQRSLVIPWYTWLIIALVLLLLAIVIILVLLSLIRTKEISRTVNGIYVDDTRENIIDYK